ncbi:MAG: response regulator transcription factor, partial [Chloroflexi bacterium]|nr:response regulator transcription factor [Chloroflexota bacterium]
MAEPRVRLLLVDDHTVVRMGLRRLFETVPHFSVVGEAGNVAQAVAEAHRCQPDVVLMDVRLPDGSGVEACRKIRAERSQTRVVVLTSYADEEAAMASTLAGAAGYLLKESEPERLIEAVEVAARGGSLLAPDAAEAAFARMLRVGAAAAGDPLADLSQQERKIVPLIAQGKTNREIAAALSLSEHTVRTYISYILQKLHLTRRAEAAAFI